MVSGEIQVTDPSSRRECWYHSSFLPGTQSVGDYQQGRRSGTSPRVAAWGGEGKLEGWEKMSPWYGAMLSLLSSPVTYWSTGAHRQVMVEATLRLSCDDLVVFVQAWVVSLQKPATALLRNSTIIQIMQHAITKGMSE